MVTLPRSEYTFICFCPYFFSANRVLIMFPVYRHTPTPEKSAPQLKATSSAPEPGPSASAPRSRPRTPPPVSQIVSNARGPYPQLEMFSVPRRSTTIQGVARDRPIHRQDPSIGPSQIYSPFTPTPTARASKNVKPRLADVSFFCRSVRPRIGY